MALHVNYEIRWQNYRAFEDTDWIPIRPITILIGANNAGKTSVISPLLLMCQTLLSLDPMTPLVTRGPLVDAGTFKDIVHNRDPARALSLGFRYHIHDVDKHRKLKKMGAYPPGALNVTLSPGERPEDTILQDFSLFDIYKRPFLRQTRNPAGTYRLENYYLSSGLSKEEKKAIRVTPPLNFLFTTAAVLRNFRDSDGSEDETRRSNPTRAFTEYLGALAFTLEELRRIFYRLAYIGPLREPLRRFYEIAGETPSFVGPRGEHMANVLRRQGHAIRNRLNHWIQRFEFGDELEVEDFSEELFSLSFKSRARSGQKAFRTNVADAGFGASQVLPLIVQALTATEGSLTIAEQPEIHLNPRLQTVLAELFVEMANSDHRVIVETHSEHLLLRLRRLVASKKIDPQNIAIYYVEKDKGASQIRRIPLDKYGNMPFDEWPKGFFEESLGESLALAQAQSEI